MKSHKTCTNILFPSRLTIITLGAFPHSPHNLTPIFLESYTQEKTYLIIAELGNHLVESVLHAVGQVERGLADHVHTEGEHLAHILQGRFVSFAGLEGLGTAHESLDVVGLVLQHGGRVTDGALEVTQLLVTRGSVVVALQGQLARLCNTRKERNVRKSNSHYDKQLIES